MTLAPQMVRTSCSPGSRQDAHRQSGVAYATFEEEYQALLNEKRTINSVLMKEYTKSGFGEAQRKVLARWKHHPAGGHDEWHLLHKQMEAERLKLSSRKDAIDLRLGEIKLRVKSERREAFKKDSTTRNEKNAILVQIRSLLERIVKKLEA